MMKLKKLQMNLENTAIRLWKGFGRDKEKLALYINERSLWVLDTEQTSNKMGRREDKSFKKLGIQASEGSVYIPDVNLSWK